MHPRNIAQAISNIIMSTLYTQKHSTDLSHCNHLRCHTHSSLSAPTRRQFKLREDTSGSSKSFICSKNWLLEASEPRPQSEHGNLSYISTIGYSTTSVLYNHTAMFHAFLKKDVFQKKTDLGSPGGAIDRVAWVAKLLHGS